MFKKFIASVAIAIGLLFTSFSVLPAVALSTGDSIESVRQELKEVQKVVPDAEILYLAKEQADNFFSVLGTKPPVAYDEVIVISSEYRGLATIIVFNEGKVATGAAMPVEIFKAIIKQALLIEEKNAN